MNKSDMITAAKIAGIPVYENAETPGGVKFGECSIHDLVRFAQIITNRSLEHDTIKSHDSTQAAVVGDLSEFGPLLTWTRHWSTITPGTRLFSAPIVGLTDVQIDNITFQQNLIWHGKGYQPFRAFARAIEAQHKIYS